MSLFILFVFIIHLTFHNECITKKLELIEQARRVGHLNFHYEREIYDLHNRSWFDKPTFQNQLEHLFVKTNRVSDDDMFAVISNFVELIMVKNEEGMVFDVDEHLIRNMMSKYQPGNVVEIGMKRIRKERNYYYIGNHPHKEFKNLIFVPSNGNKNIFESSEKLVDEETSIFDDMQLQENDIILFNSSHVVVGLNEIHYFFFSVLPLLPKGIIVCLPEHIYLPYFYPFEVLYEPNFLPFTENDLLAVYLYENENFEVLFASRYLSVKYDLNLDSTALWFRKIK